MSTVRAKETFFVGSPIKGKPSTLVNVGDVFDAKDKIVKGRTHLFEPTDEAAKRNTAVVEQATAAPGELRTVPKKEVD